jgi:hypothetical protein
MRGTLVLLLAFLTFSVSAQVPVENSTNKWWFGINTADLIVKDNLLMPALCADWNFKNQHHARVQIGYDVSNSITDYNSQTTMPFNNQVIDSASDNSPATMLFGGLRLGYYKTKVVNPKVNLFFGMDIVLQYWKSTYRVEYNIVQDFNPNNQSFIDVKEKGNRTTKSYGASPFTGIQWNVSKGVRLAFETQAMFLVQNLRSETNFFSIQTSSFNPNEFIQDTTRKKNDQSTISRLLPMSGLYLYIQL